MVRGHGWCCCMCALRSDIARRERGGAILQARQHESCPFYLPCWLDFFYIGRPHGIFILLRQGMNAENSPKGSSGTTLVNLLTPEEPVNPSESVFQRTPTNSRSNRCVSGSSIAAPSSSDGVSHPPYVPAKYGANGSVALTTADDVDAFVSIPRRTSVADVSPTASDTHQDSSGSSQGDLKGVVALPPTVCVTAPSTTAGQLSPGDSQETEDAVKNLNEQRSHTKKIREEIRMLELTSLQMLDLLDAGKDSYNEYFNLGTFDASVRAVWHDREQQDMSPGSKSTVKLFNSVSMSPNRTSRSALDASAGGDGLSVVSPPRAAPFAATHTTMTTQTLFSQKSAAERMHDLQALQTVADRHPLLLRQRDRHGERRALFNAAVAERTHSRIAAAAAAASPDASAKGSHQKDANKTTGNASSLLAPLSLQRWRVMEPLTQAAVEPPVAPSPAAAKAAVASAPPPKAKGPSVPRQWSICDVPLSDESTLAGSTSAAGAQSDQHSAPTIALSDKGTGASEHEGSSSPAAITPGHAATERPPSASAAAVTPTDYVRLLREQRQLMSNVITHDDQVYRPMLVQYFDFSRRAHAKLMSAVDALLEGNKGAPLQTDATAAEAA